MKSISRQFFLTICLSIGLNLPLAADETNAVPTTLSETNAVTQSMVNGYLQIQAQLHDTQLSIEASRREMAAEAQRNAEALTARIESLETSLAAERASAVVQVQKNQQFTIIMAVVFGLIVVAAVIFMAYLQWRAVARVVEMSALRPQELLGQGPASSALVTSAAVEQSSARLFSTVDSLQKRILELEQNSRAMLAEKPSATTNGAHKVSAPKKDASTNDRDECVANLLSEGQALLDAHEPEKALDCFDTALGLEPKHAEALVKKGGALEKLGRTDEAINCYDQAIAANSALTIAHLHKGGLFNRMARYDEALQCYEQALRTQEKKMPGAPVAA
jgi:tetratricopeptide (TPR) repeat protein